MQSYRFLEAADRILLVASSMHKITASQWLHNAMEDCDCETQLIGEFTSLAQQLAPAQQGRRTLVPISIPALLLSTSPFLTCYFRLDVLPSNDLRYRLEGIKDSESCECCDIERLPSDRYCVPTEALLRARCRCCASIMWITEGIAVDSDQIYTYRWSRCIEAPSL